MKRALSIFVFVLLCASLHKQALSAVDEEGMFQKLESVVAALNLKLNGQPVSEMTHSPRLLERIFYSKLTKDGVNGDYHLQIEADNSITVFYTGGQRGNQRLASGIFRNGKWKNGGQKVADRFHHYRIKQMIASHFGLPKPKRPSSKYVALVELQAIVDKLGLRDEKGKRPNFAQISPAEIAPALMQEYRGSQRGRYSIQIGEEAGMSIFYRKSGYGRGQTFINGAWDTTRTDPITRREYRLEKALFECLLPDLRSSQKVELSTHEVRLRPIDVDYSYDDCKSEYLAKFPQHKRLVKQLEGVSGEIGVIQSKIYKLDRDIALNEWKLARIGVVADVKHPDLRRREAAEEAVQVANEVLATSGTLLVQYKSELAPLEKRRSSLASQLKSQAMRNACLELPSKETSKSNRLQKLQKIIDSSSEDDPVRFYAMLDQAKCFESDSERSGHVARTLDACIAQFQDSNANQIHLAAIIYRGVRQTDWMSNMRAKYLSIGQPAAQKAVQQYSQENASSSELAKAHKLYGELLIMYVNSNRISPRKLRDQIRSRARYHMDAASKTTD
ncbi:hypothetical protein N9Y42_06715 [Mariniblastus sp.]|nr:hypothetical protein [Mariniblastus sp.]